MAAPSSLPLIVTQLADPDLAMTDCAYASADDLRAVAELAGFAGADSERVVTRGTLVRVNELVLLLKCVMAAAIAAARVPPLRAFFFLHLWRPSRGGGRPLRPHALITPRPPLPTPGR